ncbi:hypothetical protein Mal64_02160 [Pseudobythopirellula maris]|uniref:Choice-of-anchor A domain-containing protein n=1 Tax=Pseudobythopirellula maris TaxID=2527991 RepID=A0A5C5ZRG9_9BACT|nr:choice-of-anchor A family protein [Pseudobythopirellula maris]TWT89836.1 hypothetical protein Mal64_02160 [Pseudobythopirellula maris]
MLLRLITHRFFGCAALLALGAAPDRCEGSSTTALSRNSIVVFQDWDAGSNTAGSVVVGGNVLGQATDVAVGTGMVTPGEVSLTVVGDLANGNVNMQKGSARIGGDLVANINLNQAGNHVALAGTKFGNVNGGPVIAGGIPDISDLIAELTAESAAFAALTPNSTIDTSDQNATYFNAAPDSDHRAVFDLNFEDLFNNPNARFELNANGADEVIINVSGGGAMNNNFGGSFSNAPEELISSIVWNFYDATDFVSNRQMWGSLLAPSARVRLNQNLEGSLAAGSLVQRAEVHFPTSTVSSPLAPVIPEPSMMLNFLGLAAAAAIRRPIQQGWS